MSTVPRSRNPFRVLKTHRNFRIFWIGQTLSLIGSWMQTMALGWLSLELSNSAFVVGLVASVGAIPIVLFSIHAGAFVDRSDRLRLVRITQTVFLVEALVLATVNWLGLVTIPLLVFLAFVQGMCSAVEIPARQSMIIQLVGRNDLQPAIALNSSGFNLARVIGPAIGGLVIHRFGIAWCFALNAVSYLAVLWGLMRIRLPAGDLVVDITGSVEGRARRAREAFRESSQSAADGLRHFLKPGDVRDLLSLVTMGAVFSGSFLTLMPVEARDRLGLGAGGYGGLLASVGVGGLVGALLLAGPASHWRRGRVLTATGVLFPLLLMALAFATTPAQAMIVLFFTGGTMIIYNALGNGILQLLVPEEYRGRLMSFYAFLFVGLSQLLGALVLGAAARRFGVEWAIGGSAVVTLVFTVWTVTTSRLWRL